MKSKKKITPNSKAMELNAVLNEVGGAVGLKWNYDKKFKQWWIPNAGGGFKIEKDGDIQFWTLYKNNRYVAMFNKLSSAKLVAYLLHRG